MSDKPRLVVSRRLPEAVEARAAATWSVIANPEDRPLSVDELVTRAAGARALIVTPTDWVDAGLIGALPDSVGMIATFSVGVDHIDLTAAARRGLVVSNTPGVLTEATADLTLALILMAARRAGEGERLVRAGQWRGWAPTQLLGRHLGGRRLGIVGMGRIGRAVAERARAFGMAIHYHGRRRLPAGLEQDAVFHDRLEALLAHADVLSLHVPATPETRGLIDAAALAALPEGAILVNTARGPVVEDDAVIAALRDGRLAAAGLDVYTGEPDIDPRYLDLPGVVLLPHLGSATVETRNAMGFKALDNLGAWLAGGSPPDRVF
ncbi:2-hydroxyacid dehydrogenase [Roseospirillum parvum]|uniref:Lactate dehydrogenase n=1 Tax=Roseospirillum parvum TaxID=83401 RepID=A0A1G7YML0_9PROT|nr:D-glycerate dehydrogenase [Roseospirillum parvum]SDG97753.1 Lactate dehydrogenase [Roseospirillum parvum]